MKKRYIRAWFILFSVAILIALTGCQQDNSYNKVPTETVEKTNQSSEHKPVCGDGVCELPEAAKKNCELDCGKTT